MSQFKGELKWLGEAPQSRQDRLISFLESEAKLQQPKPFLGEVKWKSPPQFLGAVSWKDKANPNESVKSLQSWLNKMLDACGYYGIGVDGVVGPGTCGAIAMMGDLKNQGCASESLWASAPAVLYEVTSVCQGWTMPTKKGQTKPDKPTSNLEKSKYALPWQAADPQASVIQGQINTALDAIDYYGIPVTGQLDAQTCGAMKLLQDKTGVNWLDAYGMNCQAFVLPKPKPVPGGPPPPPTACDDSKCPPGTECCQESWTEGDLANCAPGTCVNKCPDGYTRAPTGVCKPVAVASGSSSSGAGLFVLGAAALGLAFFASKSELERIPKHPSQQKLQANKRRRR